MRKITLVLISVLISLAVFSQPVIQWKKCFGGTAIDHAFYIELTSDGGYIVAGFSMSNDADVTGNHGNIDAWIVKLDTGGNMQWQKSYGGTNNDRAYSIEQTSDGGYIAVGYSQSNDGDVTGHHGSSVTTDLWVIKMDSIGNLQWQKSLGGTGHDGGYSVQQTSDGGYIVAGNTISTNGDVTYNHGGWDYWLIKLDGGGSIQWQKCYGGTSSDYGYYVRQTSDTGYIVAGGSSSNDGDVTGHHGSNTTSDQWIVKLDIIGNITWQKSLGGTSHDEAYCLRQTSDGGYIVAGGASSNDGDVIGHHGIVGVPDGWMVKLNTSGNIQWQKSLGSSGSENMYSVRETSDSRYIATGYSSNVDGDVTFNQGSYDYWVIKLSNNGTMQWQQSLGGTNMDEATAILQTGDGGCIVAGLAYSTDGDVTGSHGGNDYWIIKFAPDILETVPDKIVAQTKILISPNPAKNELIVQSSEFGEIKSIEIYSVIGEKVFAGQPETSSQQPITISVADFLPGIYFITIIDQGGNKMTKKVVKM